MHLVRRLAVGLGLLLPPGTVAAQVVRVRAVDSAGGGPLVGALASLRAGPRILVRLLTDGAGRAVLVAPGAGGYQVRVDAIGYAGTATTVTLAATDTIAVQVVLAAKPFTLAELVVTSRKRAVCRLDTRQSGLVARLWDEARKALQATELTRRAATTLLELRTFDRRLDERRRIITESSETRRSATSRPFKSVDPVVLRKEGYVRAVDGDTWYYGPDAELLLSDEFLADHCFRAGGADSSGALIGLAFEPERGREMPEIAGTLWIDAKTSRLKSLEFGYVNARLPQGLRDIGGRIQFSPLPNGAWIIDDWWIRIPLIETLRHLQSTPRDTVVGFAESGGTASLVMDGGGPGRAVAALIGGVYDSLARRPLAGVRVSIAGGAYRDTTGPDGRYRIEAPITGDLVVTFEHPRFTELRLPAQIRDGRLTRGGVDTVNAWVAGLDGIKRSLCGATLAADSASLAVIGTVAGLRPDSSLEVGFSWVGGGALRRGPVGSVAISQRGTLLTVPVDSAGRFFACGIPRDRQVEVASRRGKRPGPLLTLQPGGASVAEIRLEPPPP